MNPKPDLAPMRKQLRLSGILDSLESRNKQAIDSKMTYTDFLSLLISDEVARRDQKKFGFRLRRAAFRSSKTLDQFDFDFNPKINSALVHDLMTGRFIHEKVAALIVGHCADRWALWNRQKPHRSSHRPCRSSPGGSFHCR